MYLKSSKDQRNNYFDPFEAYSFFSLEISYFSNFFHCFKVVLYTETWFINKHFEGSCELLSKQCDEISIAVWSPSCKLLSVPCIFLSLVMSIPYMFLTLVMVIPCPLYIPLTFNVCPLYIPLTCNVHPSGTFLSLIMSVPVHSSHL